LGPAGWENTTAVALRDRSAARAVFRRSAALPARAHSGHRADLRACSPQRGARSGRWPTRTTASRASPPATTPTGTFSRPHSAACSSRCSSGRCEAWFGRGGAAMPYRRGLLCAQNEGEMWQNTESYRGIPAGGAVLCGAPGAERNTGGIRRALENDVARA
jgi:hypothetical protein